MACYAEVAFLAAARLPAAKVRACRADIDGLPAVAPLAPKIDLASRFEFLDAMQHVRRGRFSLVESAAGFRPMGRDGDDKAFEKLDWETGLREGNAWFDRLLAALAEENRAKRMALLAAIDADLRPEKRLTAGDLIALRTMSLFRRGAGKDAGRAVARALLKDWFLPNVKLQEAWDRTEQLGRNLRVALAVEEYRADAGKYPATLGDLVPKYLAALPDDLYAGGPLTYRPTDAGYRLYSVGPNGRDDKGLRRDEEGGLTGDDLTFVIPPPPPPPRVDVKPPEE